MERRTVKQDTGELYLGMGQLFFMLATHSHSYIVAIISGICSRDLGMQATMFDKSMTST